MNLFCFWENVIRWMMKRHNVYLCGVWIQYFKEINESDSSLHSNTSFADSCWCCKIEIQKGYCSHDWQFSGLRLIMKMRVKGHNLTWIFHFSLVYSHLIKTLTGFFSENFIMINWSTSHILFEGHQGTRCCLIVVVNIVVLSLVVCQRMCWEKEGMNW